MIISATKYSIWLCWLMVFRWLLLVITCSSSFDVQIQNGKYRDVPTEMQFINP